MDDDLDLNELCLDCDLALLDEWAELEALRHEGLISEELVVLLAHLLRSAYLRGTINGLHQVQDKLIALRERR